MRTQEVLVFALLLSLSVAVAQTTGTEETAAQAQQKDWLIMVYMTADNDLEKYAIDDMNEMEVGLKSAIDGEANSRIESARASGTSVTPEMEEQIKQQAAQDVTSRATVVVQVDRWAGGTSRYDDKSNGNWTGTKRYVITPDMTNTTGDARKIDSTMVMDLGEVNMGDPNNAKDFETWAMENYAANNTAVIYWNHGSGWKWGENEVTDSKSGTKSVGYDYGGDGKDPSTRNDALTPMEMDQIHASVGKVDIIGFDACLMQMAEHAYQYQDDASILIGSEEVEPGNGWTYDPIVAAAFSGASPKDLAKVTVDSYEGPTLSAIDTAKAAGITNSLDALIKELGTSKNSDKVLKAYKDAMRFEDSEYGDLYSFADNIEKAGLGKNVTSAAKNLKGSINGAVIAKHTEGEYSGTGGISIWMPLENNKTDFNNYSELGISGGTSWDETVTNEVEVNQAQKTSGQVVGYDEWWRN